MTVVYIAGPMTGLPEFNYPAFHEMAEYLRGWGLEVRNPAENDAGSTGKPWEHYMKLGIRSLLDCDTIVLLPGWENSRGAKLERLIAEHLGMDVIEAGS